MSQQGIVTFLSALSQDRALAERVRQTATADDSQAAIDGVTRIATEAGYDVSAEDVAAVRDHAKKAAQEGEISDERLENVSGGLFGIDDIALGFGAMAVLGAGAVVTAGAAGVAAGVAGTAGVIAAIDS